MTRIQNNIQTITALNQMHGINKQVSHAMTRLSTGMRLNTGKDDPAGLIAADSLAFRNIDISAAIENSERASSVISVAEGALGEISDLLLEIKDLVHHSANETGLSDAERKANQEAIDKCISSIDRISQTTSFNDEHLLDGSLSYTVSGLNDAIVPIESVRVKHAVVPPNTVIPVQIEVLTEGIQSEYTWDMNRAWFERAQISGGTLVLGSDVGGDNTWNMGPGVIDAQNVVDTINGDSTVTGVEAVRQDADTIVFRSVNYGPNSELRVTDADLPAGGYWANAGAFLGAANGRWRLTVTSDQGTAFQEFSTPQTPADIVTWINGAGAGLQARYDAGTGEIICVSDTRGAAASVNIAISGTTYFTGGSNPGELSSSGTDGADPVDPADDTIAQLDVDFTDWLTGTGTGPQSITIQGNNGNRTITSAGAWNAAAAAAAIEAESANTGVHAAVAGGNTIRLTSDAAGASQFVRIDGTRQAETTWDNAQLTTFINDANSGDDYTFSVWGEWGNRNISLAGVTSVGDIIAKVNAEEGSTGVHAEVSGGGVRFRGSRFSAGSYVSVNVGYSPPASGPITYENGADHTSTTTGSDSAKGIRAIAYDDRTEWNLPSLTASLDSIDLKIEIEFGDFIGTSVGGLGAKGDYPVPTTIYITGGGANFSIGPDINITNQLSALLPNVSASELGSPAAGVLSELTSGSTNDMFSGNYSTASSIVDEAIRDISRIRGELGATQKDIIDPNVNSLQITRERTQAAESEIRDADFAEEVSKLARAQVISQSMMRALSIANEAPRRVLDLLNFGF